jgi:hypothetical protein
MANIDDYKKYVNNKITTKQDTLVSWTNVKTINSTSILWSWDISIPTLQVKIWTWTITTSGTLSVTWVWFTPKLVEINCFATNGWAYWWPQWAFTYSMWKWTPTAQYFYRNAWTNAWLVNWYWTGNILNIQVNWTNLIVWSITNFNSDWFDLNITTYSTPWEFTYACYW